ncbi:nucleoside diphosphate kinase 2, chloroplastic [Trifolium repens]|nr:nucleoside diphosphate kinase 2, chloroplastic [Trifolium repens]
MIWEGKNVVLTGRKIIGATNPAQSEPGTIRGDFAIDIGRYIDMFSILITILLLKHVLNCLNMNVSESSSNQEDFIIVSLHLVEISIKLLQLVLSRISLDTIQNDYLSELSVIVAAIARLFPVLHNSLKFEALHLLNSIISSTDLKMLTLEGNIADDIPIEVTRDVLRIRQILKVLSGNYDFCD